MAFNPALFPGYNVVDPTKLGEYTWLKDRPMATQHQSYLDWAGRIKPDVGLGGATPEIGWMEDQGKYYAGYKTAPAWQPSWATGTLDKNVGVLDYLEGLGVAGPSGRGEIGKEIKPFTPLPYGGNRPKKFNNALYQQDLASGKIKRGDYSFLSNPAYYSDYSPEEIKYSLQNNKLIGTYGGTNPYNAYYDIPQNYLADISKKLGLSNPHTQGRELEPIIPPYLSEALPTVPTEPIEETEDERKARIRAEDIIKDQGTYFSPYEQTAFQGSYDPAAWETQYNKLFSPERMASDRATYLAGIEASLLPGFEKTLAEQREQAIRQGGMSSGLISASQIEPTKEYQRNIAGEGFTYGQKQEGLKSEFETSRFGAEEQQRKDKALWQMKEDRDEKDWTRTQTTNILGEERRNRLDLADFNREKGWDKTLLDIQQGYLVENMTAQWAWDKYTKDYNARAVVLQNQFITLENERKYAHENELANKAAALELEKANIEKEWRKAQADAEKDAAIWGAAGAVIGGLTTGYMGFLGKTPTPTPTPTPT